MALVRVMERQGQEGAVVVVVGDAHGRGCGARSDPPMRRIGCLVQTICSEKTSMTKVMNTRTRRTKVGRIPQSHEPASFRGHICSAMSDCMHDQ